MRPINIRKTDSTQINLNKKTRGTLDLPQTSRANPEQCYSTHQEKSANETNQYTQTCSTGLIDEPDVASVLWKHVLTNPELKEEENPESKEAKTRTKIRDGKKKSKTKEGP